MYQFSNKPIFTDYIIGNEVITSTSFGSGGYYSHINRLMKSQKKSMELFDDSKLGICHILPTVAVRRMNHKGNYERMTNICFTVPAYCIIDITVM
jgi:NAD+ kinase